MGDLRLILFEISSKIPNFHPNKSDLVANSELQMMLNDENTDEIADKIFKLYERLAYRLIVTMDDLPKDSMPFEWYIKSTEHISEDGSSKNTPLDDSGMRFGNVCIWM